MTTTVRETWRRWNDAATDWFATWLLWRIGVPVFIAITFPIMLAGIGPAWDAELGHGVHGTFTATRVECQRTCFWHGDFLASDGSRHRADVGFASGSHVRAVGDRVPAVDTGDSKVVYPVGGGSDGIILAALMLAEVVLAVFWVRDVPPRVLRWARARNADNITERRPGATRRHHARRDRRPRRREHESRRRFS